MNRHIYLSILCILIGIAINLAERVEFSNYLNLLYSLFRRQHVELVDCKRMLGRLAMLEQLANRDSWIQDNVIARSLYRNSDVVNYKIFKRSLLLNTSLLRLPKSHAQNLLDLLENQNNGCSDQDFATLQAVRDIHNTITTAYFALNGLIRGVALDCRHRFEFASDVKLNLMGIEDRLSVFNLYNAVQETVWSQFSFRPNVEDQLTKGIATYLVNLDHPSLNEIDVINTQTLSLFLETYVMEIMLPVVKMCSLSRGLYDPSRTNQISFNKVSDQSRLSFRLFRFACQIHSKYKTGFVSQVFSQFNKLKPDRDFMDLINEMHQS